MYFFLPLACTLYVVLHMYMYIYSKTIQTAAILLVCTRQGPKHE